MEKIELFSIEQSLDITALKRPHGDIEVRDDDDDTMEHADMRVFVHFIFSFIEKQSIAVLHRMVTILSMISVPLVVNRRVKLEREREEEVEEELALPISLTMAMHLIILIIQQ